MSFSPAFDQPLPRIEAGCGIVSERQCRKAARTLGGPQPTAFDQLEGAIRLPPTLELKEVNQQLLKRNNRQRGKSETLFLLDDF